METVSPRAHSRVTLVAYQALKGVVFVRMPDERGRWCLVPECVAIRPCPICESPIGVPCMGAHGYWASDVHCARRGRIRHVRNGVAQKIAKPRIRLTPIELRRLALEAELASISSNTEQPK